MPGNLNPASPEGVFPDHRYLSFSSSLSYPMLTTQYHDGTTERALITDGVNAAVPIHTFRFTVRLSDDELSDLHTFYDDHLGNAIPFYFYTVGSTWDGSGSEFEGRFTVRFSNASWNETSDLSRTNVSVELQEVA